MTKTRPSEDYLEHFGVKGMKWGKRSAPDNSKTSYSMAEKKHLVANKMKAGKMAVVNNKKKSAVGAAALTVGVAATAYLINRHGARKMSSIVESTLKTRSEFNAMLGR